MILVTGGAGYIGSHTCVELLENGYDVLVVDNLYNSKCESLNRVKTITGKSVKFVKADVCDQKSMEEIFSSNEITSVIHFAGLKAVGESVTKPLEYYDNNLNASISLCKVMKKFGVKNLVFSSSATVYSSDNTMPLKEDANTGNCSNPYGWTKYMGEQIFKGLSIASPEMSIVLLRYFNPIGAHESGTIGENPNGIPNNLMPYITQTAIGMRKELGVFGNDYDTPDGTGVRDYIHVVDLACGHVCALKAIQENKGLSIYNLGTGHGYSVLDVVKAFEKANGLKVPYVIKPRRPGDIATCYCNPAKAKAELGWEAKYGIEEMCRDSWRFQKNNPNGYESK